MQRPRQPPRVPKPEGPRSYLLTLAGPGPDHRPPAPSPALTSPGVWLWCQREAVAVRGHLAWAHPGVVGSRRRGCSLAGSRAARLYHPGEFVTVKSLSGPEDPKSRLEVWHPGGGEKSQRCQEEAPWRGATRTVWPPSTQQTEPGQGWGTKGCEADGGQETS